MSQTFAMIKPDAVAKGVALGCILTHISLEGFEISQMRLVNMTLEQARQFYEVHSDKPFYDSLCEFMSSGPSVVMVLSRDDAVKYWRKVIGATNPKEAGFNTIRQNWGDSIDRNAVHGSDSDENAEKEIAFWFGK